MNRAGRKLSPAARLSATTRTTSSIRAASKILPNMARWAVALLMAVVAAESYHTGASGMLPHQLAGTVKVRRLEWISKSNMQLEIMETLSQMQ